MTTTKTLFTALVSSLALITACEERGDIDPAPGTDAPKEPVVGEAAVTTIHGVKVTVAADAWPGAPDVRDEVTPMKVIIHNQGAGPLNVSYDSMTLVSDDGETFAAIPPFEMEEEVDKLVTMKVANYDPDFEAERFYVVDAYDPLYDDDYAVWQGTYYQDPLYYNYYYSYWADIEMPTTKMLTLALPEGVLETDGKLSGFVYFEEIDPDEERLYFQMLLRDAKTGKRFGTIRIPFTVKDLGIQPE